MQPDFFVELYGRLPRAGPGDNESTRKAFGLIESLPDKPRILDLGCGPGIQTVELLRLTNGTVVALDLMPEMIARATQAAAEAGLSDRLQTIEADMNDMPFGDAEFDIIWSEGALYFLGFQAGLARLKPLVKPGGYVAVSEVVWLKPNPPAELAECWQAYPEIDTVEAKRAIISELGYRDVGHFVLPPSSWTDAYYDPLAEQMNKCEPAWQGIPSAEAVLAEARQELSMFQKYSAYYSYAFFVMQA